MATGHDLAMGLRAAYWAMHRRTDAHLARHGVTADQFVLLALLAQREAVTQQELVRRASSDANTVRAMLVRLEDRGLVTRARHPTDRRARSVALTRKGRQSYQRLSAHIKPLQVRLLGAVRPKQADALLESLARVSEAMAQPEGRRGRPRLTASPKIERKKSKTPFSRRNTT